MDTRELRDRRGTTAGDQLHKTAVLGAPRVSRWQ